MSVLDVIARTQGMRQLPRISQPQQQVQSPLAYQQRPSQQVGFDPMAMVRLMMQMEQQKLDRQRQSEQDDVNRRYKEALIRQMSPAETQGDMSEDERWLLTYARMMDEGIPISEAMHEEASRRSSGVLGGQAIPSGDNDGAGGISDSIRGYLSGLISDTKGTPGSSPSTSVGPISPNSVVGRGIEEVRQAFPGSIARSVGKDTSSFAGEAKEAYGSGVGPFASGIGALLGPMYSGGEGYGAIGKGLAGIGDSAKSVAGWLADKEDASRQSRIATQMLERIMSPVQGPSFNIGDMIPESERMNTQFAPLYDPAIDAPMQSVPGIDEAILEIIDKRTRAR